MALDKQIHLYSIDTSYFNTPEEQMLYNQLSKLRRRKRMLQHFKQKMDEHLSIPREYRDDLTEASASSEILAAINEKYKALSNRLQLNRLMNDTKKEYMELISENTEVRTLNEKRLTDYNVISLFESTLTRVAHFETNELTDELIVVETYFYDVLKQIIHDGFYFKGRKFCYLSSSAGQIRTKKAVFILEDLWDKISPTLMCGLSIEKINEMGGMNINKFLAYLSLSSSATDYWENFDIDRTIVVPDFETNVFGTVDFMEEKGYTIERRDMEVPIPHTDGCGMMLPCVSRKNFMVRLPWVKGLLASFDFWKFIRENDCSPVVKDIYGVEHDVLKERIQIIFTESQFKLHKYYKDWQEYKDNFRKYRCQAGICKVEENHIDNATINYQMIQSLVDVSDDEMNQMVEASQNVIDNLAGDETTQLRVFGATDYNQHKSPFQNCLLYYPELLQDEYSKASLREIKNSLIKHYKAGKLEIEGKYTFLIPDLYAWCEHLFMGIEVPKGLLANGEVCCRLFDDAVELDCLRSPHLYREHAVRTNVINEETEKWFRTKAIYTSSHDLITKIVQADCDGDTLLVISEPNFVMLAKINVANDNVVPLYYYMAKAEPSQLNNVTMYAGLEKAFSSGKIGIYSNYITKIWNEIPWQTLDEDEREKYLNVIKLLCMESNFSIDSAKTLYMPTRPEEFDALVKTTVNCKVPHFFIYAKDKLDENVMDNNESTVNRIEHLIKNRRLNFKFVGKFNYQYLMHNKRMFTDQAIIDKYKEIAKKYYNLFRNNPKRDDDEEDNTTYLIQKARNEIMEGTKYTPEEVSDILVRYLFDSIKTNRKEIFWQLFGEEVWNALSSNKELQGTKRCVKCGKRYKPNNNKQVYCKDCLVLKNREKVQRCRQKQKKLLKA